MINKLPEWADDDIIKVQQLQKIPDWIDGDILKPQHFQLLQGLIQDISAYSLLLNPYNYGVRQLKLDVSEIHNGILRLNKIHCILPDGTYINTECSLEVKIDAHSSGFVYLTLPNKQSQHDERYYPVMSDVPNWHDSYDIAQIKCLAYNFSLTAASAAPQRVVALPVAKISGICQIDNNYVPPVLHLFNSEKLYQRVADLLILLKGKLQPLGKDHKMYVSFTQDIFLLDAAIRLKSARPVEIYQRLLQILVQSSILKLDATLPKIPAYNHSDINQTYNEIITCIENNLTNVMSVQNIFLNQEESGTFTIDLNHSYQFKDNVMVLALHFDEALSRNQIIDWITNAVIENENMTASMRRVLGAPRCIVSKVPEFGLEERSNMILVVVGIDNVYLSEKDTMFIKNTSQHDLAPKYIKLCCYSSIAR